MPAPLVRGGEVGNLVVLEPRSGKRVDGREIHVAFEFFVGLTSSPLSQAIPKRRPLLEGEAVGRNMIGREIDGLLQIGLPLVERFSRCTKHQIERHLQIPPAG